MARLSWPAGRAPAQDEPRDLIRASIRVRAVAASAVWRVPACNSSIAARRSSRRPGVASRSASVSAETQSSSGIECTTGLSVVLRLSRRTTEIAPPTATQSPLNTTSTGTRHSALTHTADTRPEACRVTRPVSAVSQPCLLTCGNASDGDWWQLPYQQVAREFSPGWGFSAGNSRLCRRIARELRRVRGSVMPRGRAVC
jgi:hypothetical protein